ncbi:MAG: hypothetical protein FJ088_07625 [Deltaproteobacteria bacterium]|nr:hypothetical protein [Deltaproteobacteria bacterium]
MRDVLQVFIWLLILSGGIAFCVAARRLGLAVTYIRDILHIFTGVWVFGWRFWENPAIPSVFVVLVFAVVLVLPYLDAGFFRKFIASVSDADETWRGIVLYVFSYAAFTAAGMNYAMFPAAAALLSLSFGDGAGGICGRLFGRRFYELPWTKKKSIEGSLIVFAASLISIIISGFYFEAGLSLGRAAAAALIAAIAEAISPRGLDNLLVPASVYFYLM